MVRKANLCGAAGGPSEPGACVAVAHDLLLVQEVNKHCGRTA
jgi:hypothetical protein